MAAAPSTLGVTNLDAQKVLTISGQAIQPLASFQFPAAGIPGVCTDVNFRVGFVAGTLSAVLNGKSLDNTSMTVSGLLDGLALGTIVP